MKRVRQTFKEISGSLTNLEVGWMEDPHAGAVIKAFESLPTERKITRGDVVKLLEGDFRVGCKALRLFLDFSKDEFTRITAELFKDIGGAEGRISRKIPMLFSQSSKKSRYLSACRTKSTAPQNGRIA